MATEGPPPVHGIADFVRGYEAEEILLAFRCPRCRSLTATWGLACSRCGARPLEEARLGPTGRIVAGTVVAVPGDELLNEAPYAYVVVALDDGGRISGWIRGVDREADIAPGTPVRFAPSYRPGVQFERIAPAGERPEPP